MCRFDPKPSFRAVAIAFAVIAFAGALPASAQAPAPQDQPPQAQEPPPPAPQAPEQPPGAAQDTAPALSEEQIAQLVAPIALYPDNLLAQVLTASTYPLEVVMAARWTKDNPNVKGDALDAAMQNQNWDPSVKGLTAVPQVLDMMSEQLDWTQQLGEAYLAQPDDISDAVQRLRAKAEATGNLKSSKELRVTRAPPPAAPAPGEYDGPYIVIEPAEPDIVYVPVYDPVVVYGGWAYPAYRPFFWRPRQWAYVGPFGFGAAFIVRSALWSRYDWRNRRVYIDVRRYNRFNRTRLAGTGVIQWRHDPRHRGAVGYRNTALRAHFRSGRPAPAGIPRAAIRRPAVAPLRATAPARVAPARVAPTRVAPARVAPARVAPARVAPAARVTPRATVKPAVTPRPVRPQVDRPPRATPPRVTPAPRATPARRATPAPRAAVAPRAAPRAAPPPRPVRPVRPARPDAAVKRKKQP